MKPHPVERLFIFLFKVGNILHFLGLAVPVVEGHYRGVGQEQSERIFLYIVD